MKILHLRRSGKQAFAGIVRVYAYTRVPCRKQKWTLERFYTQRYSNIMISFYMYDWRYHHTNLANCRAFLVARVVCREFDAITPTLLKQQQCLYYSNEGKK